MAIDNKFQCEPCVKSFKEERRLKQHISVVHEGLKPFPCNQCDKKYTDSTPLRNHKLVAHTEKKNLPCPECSKVFANKPGLDHHFRRSHILKNEKRSCKYCQKSLHIYTIPSHERDHENKEKGILRKLSSKTFLFRETARGQRQKMSFLFRMNFIFD